jgi:hypothetical protein
VASTLNLKILKPEDISSELKKFPLHCIILELLEERFLETTTSLQNKVINNHIQSQNRITSD